MILKKLDGLISEDRIRLSSGGATNPLIASESDKGRIINSAPFRRMQQKAQVFPLETNAAVRSRLTHSIEVSQIGRYIAQKIVKDHFSSENTYIKLASFVNTVDTACLLHDIGNPPFGHLGEAAIQEWFRENYNELTDLTNFDGNPQGFRITSFLSGYHETGYNLTCTQLLSTIKYPWSNENKGDRKKIGIFSGDIKSYERCCDILSWGKNKKFPFVYLMEAADDIAYSMSDIEDGLEKNIISLELLKTKFGGNRFDSKFIEPFIYFKTNIINKAVELVSNNFIEKFDAILNNEDIELLEPTSEVGQELACVTDIARDYIYIHEDAEKVELAGRSIIRGLLNHLNPLLKIEANDFKYLLENDRKSIKRKGLGFHSRLFNLLPKSYIKKYLVEEREDEKERRAHLIVDYISGMTDDFALEMYQILEGIKIK